MTNVVCSVHNSYKSGGRSSDVNVNPPDTQENYSENATFASCNRICDILHFEGPIHTRQRRCGELMLESSWPCVRLSQKLQSCQILMPKFDQPQIPRLHVLIVFLASHNLQILLCNVTRADRQPKDEIIF